MPRQQDDRSLGDLFSELSREMSTLVRQEVQLATTELSGKARTAGAHAGVVAAGGALALAGLLVLLAAVVLGLAELGIAPWLSAFIVALLTIGGGYALVSSGLDKLRRTSVAPTQTIQSLKETSKWTTRTPA